MNRVRLPIPPGEPLEGADKAGRLAIAGGMGDVPPRPHRPARAAGAAQRHRSFIKGDDGRPEGSFEEFGEQRSNCGQKDDVPRRIR